MLLQRGSRLGPYLLVSPLGAGGMGEVWRAKDTRLDRDVAVKILPAGFAEDEQFKARFEREARTISALNHPHICTLFDVGVHEGTHYLVMELLDGESLADRLQKGPLPLDQVLKYGAQVAEALERAHRQGIVHRDLKPGNVVLTRTGAKLVDFGLARSAQDTAPLQGSAEMTQPKPLTAAGTVIGTFEYMAPEQVEGAEVDARADIFALGALLHEMATGRRAFEGRTRASLIAAILSSQPPPVSSLQPVAPPGLDHVVRKCLEKDPDDRWQSAQDVASELRWIAEAGSQAGAPATVVFRRRSRERLAWVAAGLCLLASLYLANDLRRLRGRGPRPIHSFLLAPEKTTFRPAGDDAAPIVVAPDGEQVAFGAGGRLFVQSLRTGVASALASTDGARFPFWSPDSRSLGFFAEGKLRTVGASGGPVLSLCDTPNPRGGAWGRDGVIVFSPDIRTGLARIRATGGVPEPLTRIDEKLHTTHRWPYFLPDGRHFLYLAANHASPRAEQSGIYLGSLDGGEPRRLLFSYGSAQYASGYLLFLREATLVAQPFDPDRMTLSGEPVRVADGVGFDSGTWRATFSASENGVLAYHAVQGGVGGQFTWFDRAGRLMDRVAEKSEAYVPHLSPDGRRLAFLIGDPNNDVWVQELDRGIRTRVTTLGGVVAAPLWSPDGTEILFVTQLPDRFTVAATTPSGALRRKIVQSPERMEPTDWSRDGRFVLYDKGNVGMTDVWALPVAEPSKAFPLVATPFVDSSGRFSPDGRWVAYTSRETGRDEVYVTSFPSGGSRWQVSGGGGRTPCWSRDGRELYFVSADGDLTAAAVRTAGDRFEVGSVRTLFRVNLYNGPRTNLVAYDVSPDGQRFLVNSAGDTEDPRLALVANWPAELRK